MSTLMRLAENMEVVCPETLEGKDLVAYRNLHDKPDAVFYLLFHPKTWPIFAKRDTAMTCLMNYCEHSIRQQTYGTGYEWLGETMTYEIFVTQDVHPARLIMCQSTKTLIRNTLPLTVLNKWVGK